MYGINDNYASRLSRMAHEYILKYGLNRRNLYPPQINFQSYAAVKTPWFTEQHNIIAHGRANPALGLTRPYDVFR